MFSNPWAEVTLLWQEYHRKWCYVLLSAAYHEVHDVQMSYFWWQWFWWLVFLVLILFLRFIQIDTFNCSVSFFFLLVVHFLKTEYTTYLPFPSKKEPHHNLIQKWKPSTTQYSGSMLSGMEFTGVPFETNTMLYKTGSPDIVGTLHLTTQPW